jgi:hypothetical protein
VKITGNIVECRNGLSADVSEAMNLRPIEVGDKLIAFGDMVADPNFQTLIKAEVTRVVKLRDVELDGVIQSVDGNVITILNQKVEIGPNTTIFGVDKLQPGQGAYVYAEFLANGFRAFEVYISPDKDSVDLGITSAIAAIEGRKVSLVGDFTVNVTEENLKFFELSGMGVNSTVFVNLRQVPKSKRLKSPFLGEFQTNLTLGGELQAVDLVNRTITVINQVVKIDEFTIISDSTGGRIELKDLNPADVSRVQVSIGKLDRKPFTILVNVFKK